MVRREPPTWPWVLFFFGLTLVGLRWRDAGLVSMKERLLAEADAKARREATRSFGFSDPVSVGPCRFEIGVDERLGETAVCFDLGPSEVPGVIFDPREAQRPVVFVPPPGSSLAALGPGGRRTRFGARPVVVVPELQPSDFAGLVRGLGVEQVAVAAAGCGVGRALALARSAPKRVAALVVDSVPTGTLRPEPALARLLKRCATEPGCPEGAPDPADVGGVLAEARSSGAEAGVDPDRLERALVAALGRPSMVGLVPSALAAVVSADADALASFWAPIEGEISLGGTLSCPAVSEAGPVGVATLALIPELAVRGGAFEPGEAGRAVVLVGRGHGSGLGLGRDLPDRCAAGLVRGFLDGAGVEVDASCAETSPIRFRSIRPD